MTKFLRVTVLPDNDSNLKENALIALDCIEQIRSTKEGVMIYYKDTRNPKGGDAFADYVEEKVGDIAKLLGQENLILRIIKDEEAKP